MTDGVDAEGGVQYGKGASDAGQHEATDSALPAVMQEAYDKGESQADEDDRRIVAVLPHRDPVLHDAGAESFIVAWHRIEQPAAVAVPEPPFGVIGIGRIVAVRMVSQMIGCPFRAGVLERPTPRHQ